MGAPEIIILIVLFLILSVMFYCGRKAFIWLSRHLKKLDGLQDSIGSCPEKWCKQAFQVFKRSAVIS